jgi:Fe-S-cluster containining protein
MEQIATVGFMEKSQLIQITRQKKITETDFTPFVNAMYEEVWGNLFPPQILTHDLSNTVSGNIITPADEPIPECVTCGACCASLLRVDVAPDNPISSSDCWDIIKEGENCEFIVDRIIKRKQEDLSCTALEGMVGDKVTCRVYDDRPRMCRKFEAGSDRCHAVRRAYGIEPFLSLSEMSEAREKLNAPNKAKNSEVITKAILSEEKGTSNIQISVKVGDCPEEIIHKFNAKSETWFQSEFEGLTLHEAKDLIIKRS